MRVLRIEAQTMPHGRDLPLPAYATAGAAGMDLHAAIAQTLEIAPQDRALVPTGLAFAIPEGFEGQVRPRSGLAWKHGLSLVNAPGTIDSDYRGEIQVNLINLGRETVTIRRGDRIAQIVFAPVIRAEIVLADALGHTERGAGGHGSTGVSG